MKGDDYSGFSRVKLFLALSRTSHGLLDIATPLLVALLWLGEIPDPRTTLLGILAAIGGYTAVYALNDLVDYKIDKEKISQSGFDRETAYLDGTAVRHPLARGYLSLAEATVWTAGWAMISLTAAYLLNPVCALILVIGCVLEAIYCLLLQVTHLRTLLSGIVKTLGGMAAIFAVDGSPQPGMLLLIFAWLFFWEIGGQNIPADWHDIEEDAVTNAKTIPVAFGPGTAGTIALLSLLTSLALSALLFRLTSLRLNIFFYLTVLLAGVYLLILPAASLFRTKERDAASSLFNRASWYPCILLIMILIQLAIDGIHFAIIQ